MLPLEDDDLDLMRVVGARLRHKRMILGLTRREVADRAGIGTTTVAAIEEGRLPNTSLIRVYRMASCLAIPVHRLLPNPRENDVDWLQRKLRDDFRFGTRGSLYAVDLANVEPGDERARSHDALP